ncbi:MAG: GNAT family N-acetyltransferase [Verrucomicrobiota bacterium]
MLLEDVLDKYPIEIKLWDGTSCIVRPVGKRDDVRLQKFFLAIPEEERLFIKHPITDRTLFRQWCRQPDFDRNLPLLMLHGKKVIGEATLHQRGGGWKRHIGLITVLTHPQYRGRDVAKLLVAELIEIAHHAGLCKLEAELNGERRVAIHALAQLGFHELVYLTDYVMDMKAVTHDYMLMGMDLKVSEEYAGIGD